MRTSRETVSCVSRETSHGEGRTPQPLATGEVPLLSRRAFVAAAACVAAGALVGCGSDASTDASSVQDDPCPYNWNDLIWDGGRPVYRVNDQVLSRWGVDVSEHQLEVDWSGVDEYFFQNAKGAHEAGIPVHTYFFSQSVNEEEAREEAAYALAQVHKVEAEGVSVGIVAYDHESVEIDGARANNISAEQFAANARAFCEVIEQNVYAPMIYGNQQDLLRLTPAERKEYPLWLAEYGIDEPTVSFNFAIWQYTNQGEVPGIPTNADLNVWFEIA